MDHAESKQKIEKRKSNIAKFVVVEIFTACLGVCWFFLWAYVSYELRLSREVIQAGLVLLYILPCLAGGKVLQICIKSHAVLYGAALGTVLYALFMGLIMILSKGQIVVTQVYAVNWLLCVLSGIAGTVHWKGKPDGKGH